MLRTLKPILWVPWRMIERLLLSAVDGDKGVVIMGYPRSGTSLLSRIVHELGYSFGDTRRMRTPDWKNPEGFFEQVRVNRIDVALMQQGGNRSVQHFSLNGGMRPQSLIAKMARLFTRVRMLFVIKQLKANSSRWAIKLFPAPYYFWREYVSSAKIVAIYRDPLASAYSSSRVFGRMSFRDYIDDWTKANEELLYHIGTKDSFLMSVESLAEPGVQKSVLQQLRLFLQTPDTVALPTILHSSAFASTHAEVQRLHELYPLPKRTEEVWRALEKRAAADRDGRSR